MKKSILIAEDNVHLRSLYVDALRREGYDVYPAENGRVALERIADNRSDLILLDIMMPHVDGIEACASAREIVGQSVPIVMLTVLDDLESIERGFAAGADDYVIKNSGLGTLLTRARYWLANGGGLDLEERRASVLARVRRSPGMGALSAR